MGQCLSRRGVFEALNQSYKVVTNGESFSVIVVNIIRKALNCNSLILYTYTKQYLARVAELADALDLGDCVCCCKIRTCNVICPDFVRLFGVFIFCHCFRQPFTTHSSFVSLSGLHASLVSCLSDLFLMFLSGWSEGKEGLNQHCSKYAK